jgi:hypothetical protein
MRFSIAPMPTNPYDPPGTEKSRWPQFTLRTLLIAVAAVALLCWIGGFIDWSFWLPGPNRFVVRNASGINVDSIHLSIRFTDGRVGLENAIPDLAAGSSVTFPHDFNDSMVHITFQFKGAKQRFVSDYIDLWRGEGWVFEIQPDGSVKQCYDYPGHIPN